MTPWLPITLLTFLVQPSQCLPSFYHRGWLRLLREGDNCGDCDLSLCPIPTQCQAGTVLDDCGCCPECGNAEGQICDLDQTNHFYGKCGDHLECRLEAEENGFAEVPEPQCVCKSQRGVCGSDGKTYGNICRFNQVHAQRRGQLTLRHEGPCETAPVISLAPRDAQNFTGNDIIFGCEVSAYPMPHLEWKKKGNHMFLPGDDAHISIQARGGPQKYGVTGWLQIQGVKKSDEGIYICHTKNKYGTTYASAKLEVIDQGPSDTVHVIGSSGFTSHNSLSEEYYDEAEDDEEYGSGDFDS